MKKIVLKFIHILILVICCCRVSTYASDVTIEKIDLAEAPFWHPESLNWDADRQVLFFVDVLKQNVHGLDYKTRTLTTIHIEQGEVNVVYPIKNSSRLLVAVKASLNLLPADAPRAGDSALRLLAQVDLGKPENVINEGKAELGGAFWFGTKGVRNGQTEPDWAAFYSVSQHSIHNPTFQIKPVTISNGLCASPNNTVLYYIDSATKQVVAYDFQPLRQYISNKRLIIDIVANGFTGNSIPDGMTIDNRGHLWIAINFNGTVLEVDPDKKKILNAYQMPGTQVTTVQFGGPKLDELFVAVSQRDLSPQQLEAQPQAGNLFLLRGIGAVGAGQHYFRYDNADNY